MQRLWPAHGQAAFIDWCVFGQLDLAESRKHGRENHVHIEPRQMVTKAEMYSFSKGDVLVGVAGDVEPVGQVETGRVAVGGAIEQAKPRARCEVPTSHGAVSRGEAVDSWGGPVVIGWLVSLTRVRMLNLASPPLAAW